MEEKVKIEFKIEEPREVEFCGTKVKVRDISLEDYSTILEDLKENIFYNSNLEDKHYALKLRFKKNVISLCTNIDTESLNAEDYGRDEFFDLFLKVRNYERVFDSIKAEYEKSVLEGCFGIIAKKVPSAKSMEKSMDKIVESINNIDPEKLELVAKSIVWNQMPALGKTIAPAEHVVEDKNETRSQETKGLHLVEKEDK
nr:MAG TPA: hypothetical protein [Caudoviricetes sp.]